jgi:hypothetical protein
VAAVFTHSFYLRKGDAFVCVGVPHIGNGPLTLIADMANAAMPDVGLHPGQSADISAHQIAIGGAIHFSLDACETWRPPAWPVMARPQAVDAALARRTAEAPAEGLASAVFAAALASDTPFLRIARRRVADFEAWLRAALTGEAFSREGVRGLVGLGHGLTPSGDDFLSGALALLDALGFRQVHASLAQAVIDSAGLTSPLSGCFLRAAAAGHVGEHLHGVVASLITGDIDAAVTAARRIGHSSGWDMLAGAATALRVIGDRP